MYGYAPASTTCAQALQSDGYFVCPQIFKPQQVDLCLQSLTQFIDDSFHFLLEQYVSVTQPEELRAQFQCASVNRRLAMVLMLGGRRVFDHLCPAINACDEGYDPIKNFPIFDCRPVMSLATSDSLRNFLEPMFDKGMYLSARIHPIIRLKITDLDYMDQWMLAHHLANFESHDLLSLYALDSPWFSHNQINGCFSQCAPINVCIGLTEGTAANGAYSLIPESQLLPGRPYPSREETQNALTPQLQCGDALIFDSNLFVQNNLADDDTNPFMAMNFQYLPILERAKESGLPGLVIEAKQTVNIDKWWQSWCRILNKQKTRR